MKVSTGKIHTIMKTKNIFLTAISALFIFAACTEEKIIDEPGVSGKGDLVIELSPSSVITKAAATNEGYVYATEEELNVEDCWIFLVSRTAVTTPILRCAAGHRGRPYRFSNRHSVSRSESAPGNFRFQLPHPQIWVFMRNGFRQKNRFFAHLLMCSL